MTKLEFMELIERSVEDGTLPSYDAGTGHCYYRQEVGGKVHRCVAGLLCSDDNQPWHNASVEAMPDHFSQLLPNGVSMDQLKDLQAAHDNRCERGWDGIDFINSAKDILGLS